MAKGRRPVRWPVRYVWTEELPCRVRRVDPNPPNLTVAELRDKVRLGF